MSDKLRQIKNEIDDLNGYIKHLKVQFEKETGETWKRIWKLSDELRDTCPHDEVKHITSYNHHNNYDDSYYKCVLCGKHVTPKTTVTYE